MEPPIIEPLDDSPLAITTRREFIDATRRVLLDALKAGTRDIWCADVDFAEWPLNEAAVIDALTRWARPHHRLLMLAQHYDDVQRRHPRFVAWRRIWGHVVEARSPTELQASDHPCVLLAGTASLVMVDRDHWRGKVSADPGDAKSCKDQLDVILQRSVPAFASTTLGL